MAGNANGNKFADLLDAIQMEGCKAPHPESGWEAMSDEEKQFEARRKEQLIREKDDQISQLQDVHKLRKCYLRVAFIFVGAFSLAAMSCLFLCGFPCMHLSDAVLVTLLTTTMANVIGVLCIAFKWLFPRK